MTNVTHRPLKSNTDKKIKEQFTSFIEDLSKKEALQFYQSFFTESEQIMFVKRLAIIMMLEKDVPYSHIAKVLEVSPSTVKRIDVRRENGQFNKFKNIFDQNNRTARFWKVIKVLIDENIHHYGATGWRWLDKLS